MTAAPGANAGTAAQLANEHIIPLESSEFPRHRCFSDWPATRSGAWRRLGRR